MALEPGIVLGAAAATPWLLAPLAARLYGTPRPDVRGWHPLGRDAAIVGTCMAKHAGSIVLDTGFGRRLVTEPEGDLVPRIC